MKIAHLTYGLAFGGIETMLVNIANEQLRLGHEVHVIVINDIVEPTLAARLLSGVKLHLMGRRVGTKSPLPVIKINRLLSKLKADVLHLHYASISRFVLLPSLRRRLCVTLHAMVTDVNSEYLSKCNHIFAISEYVRGDIRKKKGLESITVNNGVDIARFCHRGDTVPEAPFRIVQLSRLVSKIKGQDILLNAVKMLHDKGMDDVTVTFIGDGESRAELEALALRLGIDGSVIFLGSRSQEYICEHLCDYDLLVQASRFEGFGLTVVEGIAAGLPVLVSQDTAPAEIIDNGRYGFTFKCGDAADCARVIEVIRNCSDLEARNRAAYRHICDNYSVSSTAAKYVDLYRKLIIRE